MALLFFLGMLIPRQICAQSPEALIELNTDDACLEAGRLQSLVDEHLDGLAPPRGLKVEVVGGDAPGFLIKREDEILSERHFSAIPEACDARHGAFSVAIALAVEHALRSGVLAEDVSEEESVDVDNADESAVSAESVTEEPTTEIGFDSKSGGKGTDRGVVASSTYEEEGIGLRLSGGVGLTRGVMPEPAEVMVFGLDVLLEHRITIGAGFFRSWPQVTKFEPPEGYPSEFLSKGTSRMNAARLQGCFEPRLGPVAFGGCLGMLVGIMNTQGVNGFNARNSRATWVATGLRLGARVPARGPFGLHVAGDLFANIQRVGVELSGSGDEERFKDAGFIGAAGLVELFVVLQ